MCTVKNLPLMLLKLKSIVGGGTVDMVVELQNPFRFA
jgi:hypothetical protein